MGVVLLVLGYFCNIGFDSTIKFTFGKETAYFDARSKGLAQANNSKHFPIDHYMIELHPPPLALSFSI